MTLEKWMSAGGLVVSVLAFITSTWSAISTASITENEFNQRLFSDLRPWVSIKPLIKSISFTYGSIRSVGMTYEIQNHGKAPALKIEIIDGFSASGSFPSYDDPQARCDKQHADKYSIGSDNVVLLPDEKIEIKTNSVVNGSSSSSTIHLVGCIDYQTNIDKHHHQTGFAYDISTEKFVKYDFSGDVGKEDLNVSANQYSGSAKAD